MSKLSRVLLLILFYCSFYLFYSHEEFLSICKPFHWNWRSTGHTFTGATVPFGMVQPSPDTRIDGSWDGCSVIITSDSGDLWVFILILTEQVVQIMRHADATMGKPNAMDSFHDVHDDWCIAQMAKS